MTGTCTYLAVIRVVVIAGASLFIRMYLFSRQLLIVIVVASFWVWRHQLAEVDGIRSSSCVRVIMTIPDAVNLASVVDGGC